MTSILDNSKTTTEVQQVKDDPTGTTEAGEHKEGDEGANTSDTCTKPLRESSYQIS
jgi:hypothetical protein